MFDRAPIYPGPQERPGEETEGAGTVGILPNVQEMEIRSWFEANPDATAQDVFNVMQANNIPPEAVISAMGLDPQSAMAQYNAFLQAPPAGTPVATNTTAPTDEETLLEAIQGGVKDATTAVGGVIDAGLQQLGALMGMGDPSLVVLNPVNPTASVVYGTPQGSTTPTIIGNMPRSGAPVGVVTGIPALDDILAGVFNQRGQGGKSLEEIIRGVVLDKVGEESGVPVAGVAGAIEGGLGGDFDKVVDSVRNVVLQVDKKIEEEDRVDPFSIIKGPAASEQIGPVQTKTTTTDTTGGVTNDKITTGGVTNDKITTGGVTNDKITTGGVTNDKITTGGVTNDVVDEIKTILGETPDNKITTVAPNVPVPTVATPLYGQGIRGMRTEKAGVTPIEDVFDISDLSLANVLSLLAGEGDNTQRAPYYGGGTVDSSLDEIIRLLRG
jgi:hypothetical protein